MEHLLGLYEITLGFDLLNGNITEGQYQYRIRKARKLAKQLREQRSAANICPNITR